MRKLCLCILFLLFIESVFGMSINEIMYNPSGNDNNLEYVEICFDEFVNLSEYTIEDSGSSDELEGVKYVNNSFAVIVEEGFDYSSVNASVYVVGATIGNNLNNDNDIILLKDDSGDVLDAVSYFSSWGGDGNDKSLCRLPDEEGMWEECSPTAGDFNVLEGGGCDWELSLIMNSTATDDPEWQIRATKVSGETKANITIEHWIEDSYGRIVKEYSDIDFEDATSQRTSSDYTPSLDEGEGYFIKANITNISCGDISEDNNALSELIFVQNIEEGQSNESYIIIEDIDPDDPEFGEVIKVELTIYKGDTSKYAVYVHVEGDDGKVSSKSTIHVRTKYVEHKVTIPVQIKPNCDGDYKDDDYDVIVEGLGIGVEEKIMIEGIKKSLCKGYENTAKTKSSEIEDDEDEKEKKDKKTVLEEKDNIEDTVEEEYFEKESENKIKSWREAVVYESTSFKAKKLGPYIFIFALISLVISVCFTKIR